MNSSILLALIVAAVMAVSEAQWGPAYGPAFGVPYGPRYGPVYGADDDFVYPARYGVNQATQGGPISQSHKQRGFNVNYGQGDLNNNQEHQASQQGVAHNHNAAYPDYF